MALAASTIVELVATVSSVRTIVEQHPELKHVAAELLTMEGPLPNLNGAPMVPVITRNAVGTREQAKPKSVMSAAERERRSKQTKARWRKARKAGKTSLG